MIVWSSFGRSLVFAFAAAAAWVPWLVLAAPLLGFEIARGLYLAAVVAIYVAGLAPRRRLAGGLAAGLAASAIGIVAGTLTELALGLAAIVGIARSGFLYRSAPARAVAIEAMLLLGGLWLARLTGGPFAIATAFGVWSFFLVQALFFLIGGVRARVAGGAPADPFDAAYGQAVGLLERGR